MDRRAHALGGGWWCITFVFIKDIYLPKKQTLALNHSTVIFNLHFIKQYLKGKNENEQEEQILSSCKSHIYRVSRARGFTDILREFF
jgi:hypothetical protein